MRRSLDTRRSLAVGVGLLAALVLTACVPRPFDASSPWNTPMPAGVSWRDVPQLRGGHSWVNDEAFSIPVVHSGPGDPLVAVSVPNSWGWGAGIANVRIPAGITGANGTDGSLIVETDNVAFNFWQFHRSGPVTASAAAYAVAPMSGSGWGTSNPFLGAGVRAAGSSGLGGLITADDLSSGDAIPHALAVSLLGSELAPGFVAPAIAGGGGSGSIPMGSRLGIPAGTAVPGGLSSIGLRVWNTLIRSGAYVVDLHDGSAPVIFYADPLSVASSTIDPLRTAGGDLDRIMPYVRVVQ
jgi:hypothetical protein